MQKIILFYKFIPLADPEAVKLWQRNLCETLGLKGRIIIADHGINGTLGGDIKALKSYVKQTKSLANFKNIDFKWSDGDGDDFPKLSVRVRPEIVTFGVSDQLKVDDRGILGGGRKLKPKQVHELVEQKGDKVVFFDGRNAHEAAVGKFKNAVVPEVSHARDFQAEIKKPKYQKLKKQPVVTYCTGGIRCEVLSKLMIDEGFEEVYQIDGGIVRYGEEYGDKGLWEGSLYVFDDRLTTKFSDNAEDIGDCLHCGAKTSIFVNCDNVTCNRHMLVCAKCQTNDYCPDCLRPTPLTA